jgi:exosortase
MNTLPEKHRTFLALVLLAGCLGWALWPSLESMANRWSTDPRYAHGYLVPAFSLALLWMRRDRLHRTGAKSAASTWGLVFLAIGGAFQLVGGYFQVNAIDGLALFPYLVGVALLLRGWRTVAWAWPAIAFVVFMIPLPWRLETALGPPLQLVATQASTYLLQTLGFMAFAEGNVIQLDEARIGVVEACSGLSMLITFVALSTGAALVVTRPLFDRIVLVASSIPVALLANIIRIVATGILHGKVGGHAADTFYHDVAGWLMIPLALLLYWLEIWVLSHLLIETKYEAPLIFDLGDSKHPSKSKTPATVSHRHKALAR